MKIATLATKVQKNDSGKIQGIANSLTMTRSGITVTQDAGKEVVGKTVPLLLSHDWNKPSIGSVTMTAVDDDGLHYEGSLFQNACIHIFYNQILRYVTCKSSKLV